MARQLNTRTSEALDLYASILEYFPAQADRVKAMGLSRQTIRAWDSRAIQSVNEVSLERVRLVAETCAQLRSSMPARSVGDYLLGSCMADRVLPRLELVLQSGQPEIVTSLVREESAALARVAVRHLPAEALEGEAWTELVDSLADTDRTLYEELRSSHSHIPAAL